MFSPLWHTGEAQQYEGRRRNRTVSLSELSAVVVEAVLTGDEEALEEKDSNHV